MHDLLEKLRPFATYGGMVGIGIIYIYVIVIARRLFVRHPSTFTVAVLGFPNSGKTVFITSVFDQLQQGRSAKIRLTPYGVDTVEEVSRNLNSLSRGMWLPRTVPGNVFFFRAVASLQDSSSARVKLEIGDFAGEDIGELQPSSDRWLHKSDYFKYVVDADAIMLAVDSSRVSVDLRDGTDEIVNAFVAAIQIIADYKGAVAERRLRIPIALLLMKSDLIDEKSRSLVTERLQRLISVCESRCRSFHVFFVSSTGPLEDGKPPAVLRPESVVEPLEWSIRRANAFNLSLVLETIFHLRKTDERARWNTFR
jgi:GTPase SAR1 family protein